MFSFEKAVPELISEAAVKGTCGGLTSRIHVIRISPDLGRAGDHPGRSREMHALVRPENKNNARMRGGGGRVNVCADTRRNNIGA